MRCSWLLSILRGEPHALHALDRFHIVQWLNEALNQLRPGILGGAPRDELGRRLKVKKWMLLRAYEMLRLGEKQLLGRLLARNRSLPRAHLLKEELWGILHYDWRYLGALRNALVTWCRMAIGSRLRQMQKVGYRLREHLEKVIAGFEHGIPMELVEATCGKIALLRRQAGGVSRPAPGQGASILVYCTVGVNPYPFCAQEEFGPWLTGGSHGAQARDARESPTRARDSEARFFIFRPPSSPRRRPRIPWSSLVFPSLHHHSFRRPTQVGYGSTTKRTGRPRPPATRAK